MSGTLKLTAREPCQATPLLIATNVYEVFEHTADLGLRVQSPTLSELFAEAGQALCAQIAANLNDLRASEQRALRVEGRDPALLLFDWLNELLYLFEAERLLLCEFEVTVDEQGLSAVVRGEIVDAASQSLDHEIKAITYHGLKVARQADGWLAEVIVDI